MKRQSTPLTTHYADLHVHVGYSQHSGPVKITASRRLTLPAILEECTRRKGIEIVGVVDCETTGVRQDLSDLRRRGSITPMGGGGYRYDGRLLLLPAAEVEAVEENGASSHWIGYFPTIESINEFAGYLSGHVTNLKLSSQRTFQRARDLVRVIVECGGQPVPAHAFTPYRGVYGSVTENLDELLGDQASVVNVLELGLSSDTQLADLIPANRRLNYVSNSDAHSPRKIAREHNELLVDRLDFDEVWKALLGVEGRAITANYGLDPRLGKYHRTYCLQCKHTVKSPPPSRRCPACGGERIVMGVLDRIMEVAASQSEEVKNETAQRPPYRYQVPLEFVPGVGPKTLDRLINAFGSELNVLHRVQRDELESVVGPTVARAIIKSRNGQTRIAVGGGGRYGRVIPG